MKIKILKRLDLSVSIILCLSLLQLNISCVGNRGSNDSENKGSSSENASKLETRLMNYSKRYPNLNLILDEKSGNIDYHYALKYDYPLSVTDSCADSIRYYFEKSFFEISSSHLKYKGDGSEYQLSKYYSNPDEYIENFGKVMSHTSKNQWTSGVERIIWMLRKYEDEKYISYLYQDYIVVGTYVGDQFDRGFTFDKSTGKVLGWNILKTRDLSEIYKKNLLSFFQKVLKKDFSERDLEKLLSEQGNVSIENIPSPSRPPYLSPEGLAFTYEPNELVSEMYGIPHFTVPLDSLKEYLNIEI